MGHPTSVESIFSAALQKGSAEERAAFLNHACAGNDDLRLQVERLLYAVPKVGSFLERPLAARKMNPASTPDDARAAATLPPRPISEGPGTRIGPYKLLAANRRGGHGRRLHGGAGTAHPAPRCPQNHQAGHGLRACHRPLRGGAAGPGDDGLSQHRPRARRRHDRVRAVPTS